MQDGQRFGSRVAAAHWKTTVQFIIYKQARCSNLTHLSTLGASISLLLLHSSRYWISWLEQHLFYKRNSPENHARPPWSFKSPSWHYNHSSSIIPRRNTTMSTRTSRESELPMETNKFSFLHPKWGAICDQSLRWCMECARRHRQTLHGDWSNQSHIRAKLSPDLSPFSFCKCVTCRESVLTNVYSECGEALRHGGDSDRGPYSTEGSAWETAQWVPAGVVGAKESCDDQGHGRVSTVKHGASSAADLPSTITSRRQPVRDWVRYLLLVGVMMGCEYRYQLEYHGKTILPDKSCPNEKCSRVFHYSCLLDMLRSNPTTKQSFNTLYGCCPYCQTPISLNLGEGMLSFVCCEITTVIRRQRKLNTRACVAQLDSALDF